MKFQIKYKEPFAVFDEISSKVQGPMQFLVKFLIKCKEAYAVFDEISNKLHRHLCSLI